MSQVVKMDSRRDGPAVTRPVYQIERMSKSFGAFRALQGVNLTLNKGEFGAVIFIAGNRPFQTEITALLTFIRLEEFDYPAAAAIATMILVCAFVMLLLINILQFWAARHSGRG